MYCRFKTCWIVLAVVLLAHGQALANGKFYVIPSVATYAVHDDNIFFTLTNETEDFIARVTPSLELGYETDQWITKASYTFDAEAYHENTDLNSAHARSFADLELRYLASQRLTLSLDADYINTDTPVDLSLVPGSEAPGLLEGRAQARRTTVVPAVSYQFSPTFLGTASYGYNYDRYANTNEYKTHLVETWMDHRTSAVNTITYGYLFRAYRFYRVAPDSTQLTSSPDSHTPWIGLSRDLGTNTTIEGRAGPRFEEDTIEPYLLFSARYKFNDGELSLTYERDETTLLGETGKQEFQSLYGRYTRRFGPRLDVHVTPGYARVWQPGPDEDIYQLQVAVYYRINRLFELSAAWDFNTQEANVLADSNGNLTSGDLTRNVFSLGLTFTYPRR